MSQSIYNDRNFWEINFYLRTVESEREREMVHSNGVADLIWFRCIYGGFHRETEYLTRIVEVQSVLLYVRVTRSCRRKDDKVKRGRVPLSEHYLFTRHNTGKAFLVTATVHEHLEPSSRNAKSRIERKVRARSRYRERSSCIYEQEEADGGYHAITRDRFAVNTNDWRDRNPFARIAEKADTPSSSLTYTASLKPSLKISGCSTVRHRGRHGRTRRDRRERERGERVKEMIAGKNAETIRILLRYIYM